MLKIVSFLIWAFFVPHSEAAYVDTLSKCELKDQDCLKNLYQSILKGIGKDGIPELGIPAVDPIALENVIVHVLAGLMEITLLKGTATGVSGCIFDVFTIDIKKGVGYQEITCNIAIQGQYEISSKNSIVKSFLGDNAIRGKGNGKTVINQLHLKFTFPVYAQKRDDGETYMKVDYKNTKYDYEVRGDSEFAADNIYLGEVETSKSAIRFLNDNNKFIMTHFGKAFIDKAMEFYFEYAGKFCDVVPSKHYIIDDLTAFAKP